MKRLSIVAILVVCVASFFLLKIDAQSKQGILNSMGTEKTEHSNSQEAKDSTTEVEEQDVPQENVKPVQQIEEVEVIEEKEKVVTTTSNPSLTSKTEPFTVVIDPGHQAKANLEQEPIGPGAKETKYKVSGGTTGIVTKKPEYVLTLEASQLLKAQLEDRGFQVILTRSSNDVNLSNRERAEIANQHEADLFVRIHADGSESSETKGFSILVPAKENTYTAPVYEDSYRAAQIVVNNVGKEVSLHQNGLFFRSDMSGFNWSQVPVILPEIGFMTNTEEDQKLSDKSYLTNLMELLADGIEEYAISKQK